jgi:hypothetical protein
VTGGKGVSEISEENARSNGQPGSDEMGAAGDEGVSTIPLSGDHKYSLDAATDTEFPGLGEKSEVVMDEIDRYTDDDDVLQDFAERQQLNTGENNLEEQLRLHHSKSPDLSGGDLDAAWQDADVSGEETVGSSVVTPDMDRVEELGDALGINYDDDEILATADKLEARDRNRWELSPVSMESDPDADEDEDLDELLADDLDEDLGADLEDDELEADLDDEFADEVKAELDDLDENDEDEIDEDDESYDLDELDEEDLEDFLDDDFDEDTDDDDDDY